MAVVELESFCFLLMLAECPRVGISKKLTEEDEPLGANISSATRSRLSLSANEVIRELEKDSTGGVKGARNGALGGGVGGRLHRT